jgi:putative transposase
MARSICSWRLLPKDLLSWRIVYWYFGIWRNAGLFEQINSVLRKKVRIEADKEPQPTAAIMDSQSSDVFRRLEMKQYGSWVEGHYRAS